ncbi:MAG TPA: hypothetical protein VFQ75_15980 [Candidatus Limnocylindrales bacterium]|nr:hypothetical protein [Candidatus Limnocylindrales bacterium]
MTTAPTPGGAPAGDETPRPGGPPGWFILIAVGSLAVGAIIVVLGALGITIVRPAPEASLPPTGQAAERTWSQVSTALQAQRFQVQEPQNPFRPGETAELLQVPRKLLQAVLPDSPTDGYVVIYELPSNNDADRAGRDLARYVASGPGAVQYPRDTQFVIQRIGQTIVFFSYSPEANPDPRLPEMAAVLQRLGTPLTPGAS